MARTSAVDRMDAQLGQLLASLGQPTTRIQADLMGRQAELWQRASAATDSLGEGGGPLAPADVIGLLLVHGVPILEAACQRQRERKAATSPAPTAGTAD